MMNVTEEEPASKWQIYGAILFFTLLGIGSLFVFTSVFINMLVDMNTQPEIININKGAYYLFGVGMASLFLVFDVVYSKVLKKEISKNMHRQLTRIGVGSIVVVFVLPHIIHFAAADYLEKAHYQVCESRSTQWLFVRTIVYTKSLPCGEE